MISCPLCCPSENLLFRNHLHVCCTCRIIRNQQKQCCFIAILCSVKVIFLQISVLKINRPLQKNPNLDLSVNFLNSMKRKIFNNYHSLTKKYSFFLSLYFANGKNCFFHNIKCMLNTILALYNSVKYPIGKTQMVYIDHMKSAECE